MASEQAQSQSRDDATQIELSISCQNLSKKNPLSKSNPYASLYLVPPSGQKRVLGRTETIRDNVNPVFERKILVDYNFKERQECEIHVYDSNSDDSQLEEDDDHRDFLGSASMTLGELVSSSTFRRSIAFSDGQPSSSTVTVLAEEASKNRDVVQLRIRGENLDVKDILSQNSDPYLNIYRLDNEGVNDDAWIKVKKTEFIEKTLNPTWELVELGITTLCGGDYDRRLKFEVFDWDRYSSDDYIGEFVTSLRELMGFESPNPAKVDYDLINENKKKCSKYQNSGVVSFLEVSVKKRYSFLEYIKGGTDLNFTVAIDFTVSNGSPHTSTSLHFRDRNARNQYQQAIRAVGDIIQDYDADKLYPAFGFGAKVPPNDQVSHKFNLNFPKTDPNCKGVEGVLTTYEKAVENIKFDGPTNFAPIINHVAETASTDTSGANYSVLLIITDGEITDMEETKSAIIKASYLPMSIIIVGVGNNKFGSMVELDSDNKLLSVAGPPTQTAQRDIVQFVPFRDQGHDFSDNQAWLANSVLEELPTQLTTYMNKNDIEPTARG